MNEIQDNVYPEFTNKILNPLQKMDITKEFLKNIFLTFSKLDEKYVSILTKNVHMYQTAFTSPKFNPQNNYELYEKLGDSTANEAIVWYFYTVFPQLHCPAGVRVIASLKNLYGSKEYFSKFAEMLGFWPYVKATEEELKNLETRQKLLEDIFEAFLGVTKLVLFRTFGYIGVGNEIVFSIMKTILDSEKVSLEEEDLYDAKTRLKEFFDKLAVQQRFGQVKYVDADTEDKTARITKLFFVKGGVWTLISSGKGISKVAREKNAASHAIEFLKKEGFESKRELLFCQ